MSADMEKLQSDVTDKLNSEELFDLVNVVSLRKLQILSEVTAGLVFLTAKGGKLGAGLLVGMPTIEVPDPDVPGPELKVVIAVRSMENPTINQDATQGTLLTAETNAINALQVLHQLGIEGLGNLYASRRAVVPNTDTEGVVAYDVFLEATLPSALIVQVAQPVAAENGLTVTLTNVTAGATIYYTTDDSFPGKGNPAALLYAGPFVVASGTKVRWAAYKTGMRGSDIGRVIVN